jgi:hypothetical protein
LASGVAVLPDRVSTVMPAPIVVAASAPHAVPALPASKTRDVNWPDARYGKTARRSSVTVPPPTAASLASGRIWSAIVASCRATSMPSTL